MFRLYNTLTRTQEPFTTVQPGKVGIYLCGPTVYKPSHIGHMVGPVIFESLKRYLSYCGYKVTLVVNITDVDDKLIAESHRRGMPMSRLAAEMTADYMANLEALGIDQIDHFPRCTETMPEIIAFVEGLITKGHAYESQGDVYFDVSTCPDYGKLSRRTQEALHGDGGDTAERKRHSADFALWKSAKPGEPSWPSPWGPGRPGWHIECSAMSRKLLGESFDIHGGGLDLIFPHHENEIAQSECLHGKPMARFWMHNGLMQESSKIGKIGGRHTLPAEGDLAAQELGKISKSKGAAPFRELLKEFSGETIRFFILSTHYRRPIDFSTERLREVETGMGAFYRFFQRYSRLTGESFYELQAPLTRVAGEFDPGGEPLLKNVAEHRRRFLEAMDDDFNTAGGIAELFDLLRTLNRFIDEERLEEPDRRQSDKLTILKKAVIVLRELTQTLGLFRRPPEKAPAKDEDGLAAKLIELLIELRAEARSKKDYAAADRIRNRLSELGIALEDRLGGTEWSRK